MNRRRFLRRGAGLVGAGTMVAFAGCGDAAPEDMRATANLSIEAEGEQAFAEVEGKVWASSQDGQKYSPDRLTLLVRLLEDGTEVASTTKDLPMDNNSEMEYTVSFALDSETASKSLSAEATVTAVWHDGGKTTRAGHTTDEFA